MTTNIGGEVTNFKRKRLGLTDEYEPGADYLIIHLNDQIFGIPVLQIQDVLRDMNFTKVPLAPAQVSGAMNLRGRIVTAINVRRSLGLPEFEGDGKSLSVVVELDNELYSLIIDKVGDVVTIKDKNIDANPATMESIWRNISTGIYKTENNLILILDVPKLLHSVH